MDDPTTRRLGDLCRAIERGDEIAYVEVEGASCGRVATPDGGAVYVVLKEGDREALDAWKADCEALVEETRRLQAAEPPTFTEAERAVLRRHGFVIFEGRVIGDAQPPITDERLDAIRQAVVGPLPDDLVALWRTCFGGRLEYDLPLHFDGVDEPVPCSWTELFYTDSPDYHTLEGWVDHELRLLRDRALDEGRTPPERLSFLPIGGFEYLERIYVRVDDTDYGAVWAWRQALPPAWNGPLKEDGVTRVADDLRGAFRALCVEPDQVASRHGSAREVLSEGLQGLREAGEEGLDDKVRAAYLGARRGRG